MYEIRAIEVPGPGFAIYYNQEKQMEILKVGATLNFLSLSGKSLLEGYDEQTLQGFEWYRSAVLFPFPNRLDKGTYIHQGQKFAFPINEPANQNALHGFVYKELFELASQEVSQEDFCKLSLQLNYDGDYEYYPFKFELTVHYNLSPNQLKIEFEVKNTGNMNLPYGIGWHPYFMMGGMVNHYQLSFPRCKQIELDARQLPTGNFISYQFFEEEKEIAEIKLDKGFKMETDGYEVTLRTEQNEVLTLQVENQSYLQVFIPDDRRRIALEPMSSGIDAFNAKEGLINLEPGQSNSHRTFLKYQ